MSCLGKWSFLASFGSFVTCSLEFEATPELFDDDRIWILHWVADLVHDTTLQSPCMLISAFSDILVN